MLREIIIRNLATIEEQSISFGEGLNVITGETGAGKSVILKAVELILGQKGSAELIRTGKDSLEVQALFDLHQLSPEELKLFPEDWQDQELVIKRSISSNSKNKISINGNLATQQQLAKIAPALLSICSQGQNLNLLDKSYHLEIVDFFAQNAELLKEYQVAFQDWKSLKLRLLNSEQEWGAAEEEREDLESELKTFKSLGLHPDLRTELTKQIEQIKGQGNLLVVKDNLDQLLNSEVGLFELIPKIGIALRELKKLKGPSDSLDQTFNQFSDIAGELENEIQHLEFEENSELNLEELEDRLAELARIQRKYRTDDIGLIDLYKSKEKRLSWLNDLDAPDKLRANFEIKNKELDDLLSKLTKNRTKAIPKFEKSLVSILKELNLPNARVEVVLESLSEPRSFGKESLEFLISLNPGEVCKPLRKVASGGEMSRILLGFKSIFNQTQTGCCFIFDEIDTGISGATARIVGEKLKSIAKNSQVLCITHLAQVASLADHHLKVEKFVTDRTFTQIESLSMEKRVDEVARLLSGREISDTARASAVELIQQQPH